MDKTIGISELRKSLASTIKDVHERGSRYIILQHSQAKAVLLSPAEMETLEVKTERRIKVELTSYEKFFGKK